MKSSEELRDSVRARYRAVAQRTAGHFPYPVGRTSALDLGYQPEWLEAVPPDLVDRFVGVGNPFRIRTPQAGDRVIDLGCGCGLDAFVAAGLVGAQGRVVGIDLTQEMLAPARRGKEARVLACLEFLEGDAGSLPFPDESFDLAISNGVLNLVPDKGAVFREIRRVLRPGGTLAAADLLVVESVPAEVLANLDAWSS